MDDVQIQNEFERALKAIENSIFSEVDVKGNFHSKRAIAIGYSGGIDSTVLLDLLCSFAEKNHYRIFAFHIHHGLNKRADDWLAHCRHTCESKSVIFDSEYVHLKQRTGESIETQARRLRYEALGMLCRKHGVGLLLSAHHQNDQVETILMHYMRGTGLSGLSGMQLMNSLPELLGENIVLARPLLNVSKQQIISWQQSHGLSYIEDDSNIDEQYTRNAVRHRLMPMIESVFPQYEARMLCTAEHISSARRILDEIAQQDLELACTDEKSLNLLSLSKLSSDRRRNVLRYWLECRLVHVSSSAWFDQVCQQVFSAREDAQIRLPLSNGCVLCRYRGCIQIVNENFFSAQQSVVRIDWHGEHCVSLHQWHGKLYFEQAQTGFERQWLMDYPLMVCPYISHETIKLSARPTKKLKILCQEKGIAAWERRMLPLVYRHNELIFVGHIGSTQRYMSQGERRIQLRWESL